MSGSGPTFASSLLHRQHQRLAPLLSIGDPQARLARILHDAVRYPALESPHRIEGNRVEGCLVRFWFVAEMREGRCFFRCDSDAVSLKAIGSLLCELYSDATPEEIVASPSGALKHAGVLQQLAENRRKTLGRLEDKMRHFAAAHQTRPA
jgi:cysteine desulfuration protein SufE